MAEIQSEVKVEETECNNEKPPSKDPIFWCITCKYKLPGHYTALVHMRTKSHRLKKNALESLESRKRVLQVTTDETATTAVVEPVTKKAKAEEVHCFDCNIVLNNPLIADAHFKGKKHLTALAKKANANSPMGSVHYCECCKLAFNSAEQIQQHYAGRKHKTRSGQITRPQPANGGVGATSNGGYPLSSVKSTHTFGTDQPPIRGGGRGRGDTAGRSRGKGNSTRGRGFSSRGAGRGRGRGDRGEYNSNRGNRDGFQGYSTADGFDYHQPQQQQQLYHQGEPPQPPKPPQPPQPPPHQQHDNFQNNGEAQAFNQQQIDRTDYGDYSYGSYYGSNNGNNPYDNGCQWFG